MIKLNIFNRGETEDTECFCGQKKTFTEVSLKVTIDILFREELK